jgi:hypothetical protein
VSIHWGTRMSAQRVPQTLCAAGSASRSRRKNAVATGQDDASHTAVTAKCTCLLTSQKPDELLHISSAAVNPNNNQVPTVHEHENVNGRPWSRMSSPGRHHKKI